MKQGQINATPNSMKMSIRSLKGMLVFALLSSFSLTASAFKLLPSGLKDLSPHESTILAGVTNPSSDRYVPLTIYKPGRDIFMEARLWRSAKPTKGLFIVMPGTGGDASSGTANSLAEFISKNRFDALVVANPFSSSFQSSFSSDGLVGFPQKDLLDAEQMIEQTVRVYSQLYTPPSKVNFIGFSLGGTYSVLLSNSDFSFDVGTFIALNPPVDFGNAISAIDDLLRTVKATSRLSLLRLIPELFPLYRETRGGLSFDLIPILRKMIVSDDYRDKQTIGAAFDLNLMDIVNGLHSTETFSSREWHVRLTQRTTRMTFQGYLGLVGIPLSNRQEFYGRTFDSIIADMDLPGLIVSSKRKSRLYVIHNADDFLLRAGDLEKIDPLLPQRMFVFDGGGHCGNYWTPNFQKVLKGILK